MKVYVCYGRTPYEGSTEPLVVFSVEKEAIEWCKDEEDKKYKTHDYFEYETLEVQE